VAHAGDGAEALASIEREMPRLILLDIRMPVVGGEEFIRRFRERHRAADVRIVLMTAYSEVRRPSAPLPVDATIRKPFEVEELLATIKELLGRHAHA
jgi:CheY-like chemotaxis protein